MGTLHNGDAEDHVAACHEKVADGREPKNTATRDAACMRLILTGTSNKNKMLTASLTGGALAGLSSRFTVVWLSPRDVMPPRVLPLVMSHATAPTCSLISSVLATLSCSERRGL